MEERKILWESERGSYREFFELRDLLEEDRDRRTRERETIRDTQREREIRAREGETNECVMPDHFVLSNITRIHIISDSVPANNPQSL